MVSHITGSEGIWSLPSEEQRDPLWVDPGAFWLLRTRPWLTGRSLSWQGSRVQFERGCWLCFNPGTRMPLTRSDLGKGFVWGLSVYCPEAPLPQSMAEPTYVHTLMCFFIYLCFAPDWQRSEKAWSHEDAHVSAVLSLPAC